MRWARRPPAGPVASEWTAGLGGNDLPASFAVGRHALGADLHGWDLARALDGRVEPCDALTDAVWEAARMVSSDDAHSGRDPRRSVRAGV